MRADALQHILHSSLGASAHGGASPSPASQASSAARQQAAQQIRLGAAWEQQATVPRHWSYSACAGRLVELSGSHAAPLLSLAFVLVADAQRAGEPVAWIQGADSTFFPPDVARNGVDLNTLTVVRLDSIPARVRAAVRLLRSGAFGLVGMDLSPALALPPLPDLSARQSPQGMARRGESVAEAKSGMHQEGEPQPEGGQTLARSPLPDGRIPLPISKGSAFGGPMSSSAASNPAVLRASPGIPPALLGKLGQLAQQHNIAVCCLTVKRADWASLGSLVSLRGEAVRQRTDEDHFTCTMRVLKDKRNGPGWIHEEAMHGTPGLS